MMSVNAKVALAAEKYDNKEPKSAIYASMAKPLERFFRDAKLNQIGEGSSDVHKTVQVSVRPPFSLKPSAHE